MDFEGVSPYELRPPSARKHDFNLIGHVTSSTRWVVTNIAKKIPKGFVRMSEKGPGMSMEQIRNVLLDSTFTLCPIGHNPEAHRIYEAAAAGSIPIIAIDDDYKRLKCKMPLAPIIDSDFLGSFSTTGLHFQAVS